MSRSCLCVHCDLVFESTQDKPRCPKCMRAGGVESVAPAAKKQSPKLVMVATGAAALVVLIGAVAWWVGNREASSEYVPFRGLEVNELIAQSRALGVYEQTRAYTDFLSTEPKALRAFAQQRVQGKKKTQDKAHALMKATHHFFSTSAFRQWSRGYVRPEPVMGSAQLLELAQANKGRLRVYPFEMAALMTAALRVVDVAAMLTEVYGFEDATAPADPSGALGYFVVAVYEGRAGEGTATFYDPYTGQRANPAKGKYEVLSDVQALGSMLNLDAFHALRREDDVKKSVALAQAATKLFPRSATVRAVYAHAQAAAGAGNWQALFDEALQLRADAPRHAMMAEVMMSRGETAAATEHITSALQQNPDYASAYINLAAIHLAAQETDLAEQALSKAERADASWHTLPLLQSQVLLARGKTEQAVVLARAALRKDLYVWQERLMWARVLGAGSAVADMKQEAKRLVSMGPMEVRDQRRALVEQVLGAEAFDSAQDADTPAPGSSLSLGSGALTGEGEASAKARLLDEDEELGSRFGGRSGPSGNKYNLRLSD